MFQKMWNRVQIDEASFKENYETWLDEEVWTYFD